MVRQYAKALIILAHIQEKRDNPPVSKPASSTPQLGDDAKQVAKDFKASKKEKKKRSTHQEPLPELRASWAGQPAPSEQELAELAEQAKLALEQAAELAGEPVVYVGGQIIAARMADEDAPERSMERYKIINGW
jgi:hypothetical protein